MLNPVRCHVFNGHEPTDESIIGTIYVLVWWTLCKS
jgi:hypothetical protein